MMNKEDFANKFMRDDNLFPFFGMGKGIVPSTYQGMDEENYVLPDAYLGSNHYLKTFIISQVRSTDVWGTTVALPWKKQEGTMEIAWDQWHFNDTMMTRTPEEAVSRLLTSHFESSKAYTVRYGIALIMEHGFWKTEKGQIHYAMQLIQIRNAIVFTAQYGVTLALLNPPAYIDDNQKYLVNKSDRTPTQVNNFFQSDLDEFACFNKQEHGWITELGRLDERLKVRNQQTGNLIIVPSNSKKFVNNRPENKWHFLSGGVSKFDQSELSAGDGRMVVESIMHKMGEHQLSQDPCYREQVIGGFFQILDLHLGGVDPAKLKNSMYDTFIYSETKDDMYRICYKINVRNLGLYHNWENATGLHQMPLTDHLGRKIFAGVNTWGQVYEKAGKLEDYIKQLTRKDEITYRDFLNKFIHAGATEADNAADAGSLMSRDRAREIADAAAAHVNAPEEKQSEQTSDISTSLFNLHMRQRDFPETHGGHRTRLTVMLNWLDRLDNEAKENGFSSNMRHQVAAFVEQHPTVRGILDGTIPSNKNSMAMAYQLAWAKAQDLLVLYDLELSTRKQTETTPVESYALDNKGWGGMSRNDFEKLHALNENSPYWKPAGPLAAVTEVTLVAPETGAGDAHSLVKRLKLPTDAFTLASSFVVLFSVSQREVEAMTVNHGLQPTTLGLTMNWKTTSPEMLERAAKLQYSIVMSAMFATLSKLNSKSFKSAAEEAKEIIHIANEWIKLATPEHILTRNESGFSRIVETCKAMPVLDYQAPMDSIIVALRDALGEIYTTNINRTTNVDSVAQFVLSCSTRYVEVLHNTRVNGGHLQQSQQAEPAGAPQFLGYSEPTAMALNSVFHKSYPGAFKPAKVQGTVDESILQERLKSLQHHAIKIRDDLKKIRSISDKDAAQLKKLKEPAGKLLTDIDASEHWKPTYLKLASELKEAEFNAYLDRAEWYINYADQTDDLKTKLDAELHAAVNNAHFISFMCTVATVKEDATGISEMGTVMTEIQATMRRNPQQFTPVKAKDMALELTRLMASFPGAFKKFLEGLDAGKPSQKSRESIDGLVFASLLVTAFHKRKVHEALSKADFKPQSIAHGKFPLLFLNSNDARSAAKSEVQMKIDYGSDKKLIRINPDVVRAYLMNDCSIEDGYFWKWSIENDMIQAIGMLGFRPSKRYEMGTMIILSAWGDTGYTFYGHADMMLSDNAATKMHYGHFTYYAKSQVLKSNKIIHGRNVVCRDYLGGNGHRAWDASNPDDREDYQGGNLTNDIFFVPVLMNHQVDTNHMDITGVYHPDIAANEEVNRATHYDAAAIYRQYWGWRNNIVSLTDKKYSNVHKARDNTICFQEHQHLYNHGSGKFDLTIIDKGHWGDRVYPGCGRARRGVELYLKPVKYDNTNTVGFVV